MRRAKVLAASVAILAAFGVAGAADLSAERPPRAPKAWATTSTTTTAPCQEDEPCWDWRTMGNGCRGDERSTTTTCV